MNNWDELRWINAVIYCSSLSTETFQMCLYVCGILFHCLFTMLIIFLGNFPLGFSHSFVLVSLEEQRRRGASILSMTGPWFGDEPQSTCSLFKFDTFLSNWIDCTKEKRRVTYISDILKQAKMERKKNRRIQRKGRGQAQTFHYNSQHLPHPSQVRASFSSIASNDYIAKGLVGKKFLIY